MPSSGGGTATDFQKPVAPKPNRRKTSAASASVWEASLEMKSAKSGSGLFEMHVSGRRQANAVDQIGKTRIAVQMPEFGKGRGDMPRRPLNEIVLPVGVVDLPQMLGVPHQCGRLSFSR